MTGETIVLECELDAPPDKVWRALTEPELVARWLAPNDLCAEPGARFSLREPGGAAIECEVLEAERPRKLSYRWRHEDDGGIDSVVSFELTEALAGRTRLRLVHAGFPLDIATPLTQMSSQSRAGGVVSLALVLAYRGAVQPLRRAA
jgi:uncharacterized protein YndB with AHSA1/START domain